MKITLRRVNALQNAIQEQIKSIEVNTSVTLNEFQKPGEVLASANSTVVQNDLRRAALTKALYRIRAQVGRANTESGVADLLADAAYIDKRLGQLKGLTESTVAEDFAVVEGKLEKLRTADTKSRVYGYSDTVSTGVLTAAQVDAYKDEMREQKKLKQTINDKVLELNVRTEIELDAVVVQILQSEKLV